MGTGWPDLVLVKGGRILFVELKAEKGVLTEEQKQVLMLLQHVGEGLHLETVRLCPSAGYLGGMM